MSEYLAGAASIRAYDRQTSGERFHVDQTEWLIPNVKVNKTYRLPEQVAQPIPLR